MTNKSLVKSFHDIFKFSAIISALLLMGCGGGSSKPEPEDTHSLAYDSSYTSLSGEVKIKMTDMVNNSHVQETILLKDFTPVLGDCPIEPGSYTITPDTLTFTEETPQALTVVLETSSPCYADTLTINATRVISTVQSGVTLSPESSTIALGFSIPVNLGQGKADSIQFVSANPSVITLSGMGGIDRPENALVSFMVKDENGNPMAGETVQFSLTTSVGGLALAHTSDISDYEGMVSAEVLSGNVPTSVAVIATLADLSASTQSSDVTLADTSAYSIQFETADPLIMSLSGMGGAGQSDNSFVSFMVKDKSGDPVSGETVNFELTTEVGGLTLSTLSDTSDADGIVRVNVLSGTVSTSVAVIATLSDLSASAQSSLLSVNTGFPDQDSFSLSVDTFNPEGLEYDGETVTLTIRAADHFNNPVPDGTAVYFTTEGGAIAPSCTTIDGTCSVIWTSQDPRPSDGRSTVLVTAIGSESFIDANGNGVYDTGEKFTDLSEAFRDDDEDNFCDIGSEEISDFNGNEIFDAGNAIFNGYLCSGTPGCTVDQVNVRTSTVITMSGSTAIINTSSTRVDLTETAVQDVVITVYDVNGNPMPKDTSVTVTTTNGEISGPSSFTVGSTNHTSANPDNNMRFTIQIEQSDVETGTGSLTVTVTTPNGVVTTRSITVID